MSIAQDHGNEEGMLADLRQTMLEFVRIENEMQQFKTAAESVHKKIRDKAITDEYSKHLKDELERLKTRGAKKDLEKHEKFVDFEERLQAATASYEPEQEAEDVQIDGDLIMTQGVQSTKCPYTQQEMEYPVKNKHCGHTYDREGIAALIKHRGNKARCPVGGCPNTKALVVKDLVADTELRAFILRKNSQRHI
ncbi:hypothetical protein CAPTEDRAFT_158041 [Capitella teleta]|uniref:E3 SUMO-protein ligase NSE2 n=1 Tax=Capitella teleta TaxID=283909 RepID=R7UYM9_CAPTE|nr:hypothetical protein CAPTEDRAFT_158041 [Capitella teleta]|eukprot:ELU09037.1 hypothetical protein CAPTEDRAFT_158041 [Capitella teleta]